MTIKVVEELTGPLAADAWDLYREAFDKVNADAAQRHLMYVDEFDHVMKDPRVGKYLTLDDAGNLAGVAAFTNDLDAVPLIAPPFFERRWPQHYQDRRIFYIMFLATSLAARRSGAFTEILTEFYRIASAADGLVGMDICLHNEVQRRLPRAIQIQLARLSAGQARAEKVDYQGFWMFDMDGRTLRTAA